MLRMRSKAMGDAPVAVQARLFAGRKISLVLKMVAAGCLSPWLMPYQASAAEKQGPRLSEALGPTEPFASNPPGAVSDNQGAVPDNQGAAAGAQDGVIASWALATARTLPLSRVSKALAEGLGLQDAVSQMAERSRNVFWVLDWLYPAKKTARALLNFVLSKKADFA
jgi:hypothetical protein